MRILLLLRGSAGSGKIHMGGGKWLKALYFIDR